MPEPSFDPQVAYIPENDSFQDAEGWKGPATLMVPQILQIYGTWLPSDELFSKQ